LEISSSLLAPPATEVLRWWQRASIAVLTSVDGRDAGVVDGGCGVRGSSGGHRRRGIPEMIEEGVTGLLAAPGNRKSWPKHCESSSKIGARKKTGWRPARRRAEEHFSLPDKLISWRSFGTSY